MTLTPQEIQFERLEIIDYNNFCGKNIAESLRNNPDLWTKFVVGRFDHCELIELRDMDNCLNVDTLMVAVPINKIKDFIKLAGTWNYDEIGWNIDGDDGFEIEETAPCRSEMEFFDLTGGGWQEDLALFRIWWD